MNASTSSPCFAWSPTSPPQRRTRCRPRSCTSSPGGCSARSTSTCSLSTRYPSRHPAGTAATATRLRTTPSSAQRRWRRSDGARRSPSPPRPNPPLRRRLSRRPGPRRRRYPTRRPRPSLRRQSRHGQNPMSWPRRSRPPKHRRPPRPRRLPAETVPASPAEPLVAAAPAGAAETKVEQPEPGHTEAAEPAVSEHAVTSPEHPTRPAFTLFRRTGRLGVEDRPTRDRAQRARTRGA